MGITDRDILDDMFYAELDRRFRDFLRLRIDLVEQQDDTDSVLHEFFTELAARWTLWFKSQSKEVPDGADETGAD